MFIGLIYLLIREVLILFSGYAVAVRYKLESLELDSRWGHWGFSLT